MPVTWCRRRGCGWSSGSTGCATRPRRSAGWRRPGGTRACGWCGGEDATCRSCPRRGRRSRSPTGWCWTGSAWGSSAPRWKRCRGAAGRCCGCSPSRPARPSWPPRSASPSAASGRPGRGAWTPCGGWSRERRRADGGHPQRVRGAGPRAGGGPGRGALGDRLADALRAAGGAGARPGPAAGGGRARRRGARPDVHVRRGHGRDRGVGARRRTGDHRAARPAAPRHRPGPAPRPPAGRRHGPRGDRRDVLGAERPGGPGEPRAAAGRRHVDRDELGPAVTRPEERALLRLAAMDPATAFSRALALLDREGPGRDGIDHAGFQQSAFGRDGPRRAGSGPGDGVLALRVAGLAAKELGRLDEGLGYLRRALELTKEAADAYGAAQVRMNLVGLLTARGDVTEALAHAREAETVLHREDADRLAA